MSASTCPRAPPVCECECEGMSGDLLTHLQHTPTRVLLLRKGQLNRHTRFRPATTCKPRPPRRESAGFMLLPYPHPMAGFEVWVLTKRGASLFQQHAGRSILYGLTSTCKYAPISWGEVYMYANPSSGACVYRGKYGPVTHQKQPPFLVEQWASGRKSPREGRAPIASPRGVWDRQVARP